ncbi:TPR repeat region-containing protein [Allosalinactinospora lopnorensis]|uniref:TPR repeat region-containing protein n=1 Tax=Allosalinactinospora lopnorensis TaxID=1352348 RepID=UPI000623DA06|nr:hypothetical protein [Allosalinactinospora lopnorensis]
MLQSLNAGSFAFKNATAQNAAIEYLETLFGDLEDQAGPAGLPQYIGGDNGLTAAELRPLADGILTLSDTDKGGSFDALPQSIKNVVTGPGYGEIEHEDGSIVYSLPNWQADVPDFARLMGTSDPDLQGGYGFSINLTSTIGGYLNQVNEELSWGNGDSDLGTLLDVSTRNVEANHGLLTGENGQHPGIDRHDAIEGLFTYEWSDNGRSAAGLVDWIPDHALNEDDPEAQELAGDAAAGLMETITSDDMYQKLTDTGVTIGDDTDASMGAINGRIAEGFTDIFMTYIDEFAAPDGVDQLKNIEGDGEISRMSEWNSSHSDLRMDPMTRVRFLEYAAGDPDSAIRAQATSTAYNDQMINRYLTTDVGAPASAEPAGTLQGLVDAAVNNEAIDRLGDEEKAHKEQARVRKIGMGVAGHAVGKIPYAGGPLGGVFMSEIDNAMKQKSGEDFSYNTQTNNGEFIRRQVELGVLEGLVSQGEVAYSDLSDELVGSGPDGEPRLLTEDELREAVPDERASQILEGEVSYKLESGDVSWPGGAVNSASSRVNTYVADHGEGYDAVVYSLRAQSTDQYDDRLGEGKVTRLPKRKEN